MGVEPGDLNVLKNEGRAHIESFFARVSYPNTQTLSRAVINFWEPYDDFCHYLLPNCILNFAH